MATDEAAHSLSDDPSELRAARAVDDYLLARGRDRQVRPERFVPPDPRAAGAFWQAIEGLTLLGDGPELSDDEPTWTDLTPTFSEPDTPPPPAAGHVSSAPSVGMLRDAIPGYRIIAQLSSGGQGIVYQAVQAATKRKVAIKILLAGRAASTSAKRRFEREIELVARLRHPNIISIFHSGETHTGQQYYVMDYVRGQPLHQYVRQRQLSLDAMLELFATVCDAIQYAHQRGVIHRDLKPSNILIDADGTPKVLDFGLAKHIATPMEGDISLSQDVIGTLKYMSPEQAGGNPDEVDTRTDIYALGVILYRLLTGRYPYSVDGPMPEVLRSIMENPPNPPGRAWTSNGGILRRGGRADRASTCPIDTDLSTIVLKALAKERDRRYQSAGEFARDLRHYLTNEPIEARRDSPLYLLRKTLWRYKAPVAVGVAMVGLVLIFAVMMSIEAERNRDLAEEKNMAAQRERDVKSWALEEVQRAEALAKEWRHTAYDRAISLAMQAPERAPQMLDTLERQDRHWEWQYLRAGSPPPTYHRPGPDGPVTAIDFNQDGAFAINLTANGPVWWDPNTPASHRELSVPTRDPQHLALATLERGGLLAIAGGEQLAVVDAASGRPYRTALVHEVPITALALDPSGLWVATGDARGQVIVAVATQGEKVAEFKVAPGPVRGLTFSPGGDVLVVADGEGTLSDWDLSVRRNVRNWNQIDAPTLTALAYSKDGSRIVSGHADGSVRFWDPLLARPMASQLRVDDAVTAIALSAGGLRLWLGQADGTVVHWRFEPPRPPPNSSPAPPGPLIMGEPQ